MHPLCAAWTEDTWAVSVTRLPGAETWCGSTPYVACEGDGGAPVGSWLDVSVCGFAHVFCDLLSFVFCCCFGICVVLCATSLYHVCFVCVLRVCTTKLWLLRVCGLRPS